MTATSKDSVVVVSLVLALVSLVLLFGVTWYFQSSLDLLQQQVEYDRELLLKLQEHVEVSITANCFPSPSVAKTVMWVGGDIVSRSQTLFFLLCGVGKEKGLVNIV